MEKARGNGKSFVMESFRLRFHRRDFLLVVDIPCHQVHASPQDERHTSASQDMDEDEDAIDARPSIPRHLLIRHIGWANLEFRFAVWAYSKVADHRSSSSLKAVTAVRP